MAILGVGLHLIVAIFFAVHVARTGQPLYWLGILFSFPLLGSVVYFFAVYMPGSRVESSAKRAVTQVGKALDPDKELREARAEFEHADTAQNRMRFAAALLERGHAGEAAEQYRLCLDGPFAKDAEIRFKAAQAFETSGSYADAVTLLESIRSDEPHFRKPEVSVLLAKSLNGAGRGGAARDEFEAANQAFDSFDVKAEYAICALNNNDSETAQQLIREIEKTTSRWNRATRELNAPLLKRLNDARNIG